VRLALVVVISAVLSEQSMWGQQAGKFRFEDYPVTEIFESTPAMPQLVTPEERRFRTVIRQGVSKGWGVEDGITGREMPGAEPNFAGHYFIITWGCGSPCLMAAIVDARNGRVFPPPFHHGPGHSYFQVPWAFPATPALNYRLNSRLLIANICESDTVSHLGGQLSYQAHECGPHYFVMGEHGMKLIHRVLE
jgi:hypothetical protein